MSVTIIDQAINPSLLKSASECWPERNWEGWHYYKNQTATKFGTLHHSLIPRGCLVAIDQLADVSSRMIGDSFIDYDLHAAGLHMIPAGGFLSRHLDAEFHPMKHWRRTHSVVLFVDDWDENHGGSLLLEGFGEVYPKRNQVVIFETKGMWHEVTRTSEDAPDRRTIALFGWNHFDGDKSSRTHASFKTKTGESSTSEGLKAAS